MLDSNASKTIPDASIQGSSSKNSGLDPNVNSKHCNPKGVPVVPEVHCTATRMPDPIASNLNPNMMISRACIQGNPSDKTEDMRLQKDAECSVIRPFIKDLNNNVIPNKSDPSKRHKGMNQINTCSRTSLMIQGYRDDNHNHEGKQITITSNPDINTHVEPQNNEQTNISYQFENKQTSKGSFCLSSILNVPANSIHFAGKGNHALAKDMRNLDTDIMMPWNSDSSKIHEELNLNNPCSRTNLMSQVNREDHFDHKGKQGATSPYPANIINLTGKEDRAMAEHRKHKDTASINDTERNSADPSFQCEEFRDKAIDLKLWDTSSSCKDELNYIDKPRELELTNNPRLGIYNHLDLSNQSDLKLLSSKQCKEKNNFPEKVAGDTSVMSKSTKDQMHNKELEHKRTGRRKLFDPG